MGLFDSLKNALGGNKGPGITASVKSPSETLRDAGIDPSGLRFGFSGDNVVTVSGEIAAESDRQAILDALGASDHIKQVVDSMVVAAPAPEPAPEPEPAAAPESEAAGDGAGDTDGGRSYTVQSGDTLWKISQDMYGDGSKYMKIFEANKPMLDNPDKIFPGQELVIPDLED